MYHSRITLACCLAAAAIFISVPSWARGKKKKDDPQRDALVQIYNATGGRDWTNNDGWASKADKGGWFGVTVDSEGNVTEISLPKNNLAGVLPDVFDAFPELKSLKLNDNRLTGQLPASLSRIPSVEADLRRNTFELTTFKVPNDRIETVAEGLIVYPQNDNAFRLFVDSEIDGTGQVHPDKSAVLYQKHTEGAGVEFYIIGDGYDQAENTVGGTADYWYKVAAEAFFDVEPYKKMRNLFDVYFIYAHSPQKGVTLYDNPRNSRFMYSAKKYTTKRYSGRIKATDAFNFIMEAIGHVPQDSSAVQVCINSTHNRIGGGVETRKTFNVDGRKATVGFGHAQTRPKSFRGLVRHETGGHAQGFLLDEYSKKSKSAQKPLTEKKIARINRSANLDLESDPAKVKWARFIADPRYADEKIGVYEGGATLTKGVYRPAKTSLMINNKGRYNAPSRAAIYRIIMRRAYPDTFVWDYEQFVKFDLGLE